MKIYRGKALGELDPHVYAVAEEAVNKMEQLRFFLAGN
jgi:myosin heavy subunit